MSEGLPTLAQLRLWAKELDFEHLGVADLDGFDGSESLAAWLKAGSHGDMAYMARDVDKRAVPQRLMPGVCSAIMVGARYAPRASTWRADALERLEAPGEAYVSNYARGRDYHKRVRRRLARLAARISEAIGPFGHRAFCDSAPVMEVALAARAGLGWRGKNTLLLNREQGSMFFIGTLYTDLKLPRESPATEHCGSCRQCLDVCPTNAFEGPYRLDARRCISYLTIEHPGAIPEPLRAPMGNRIYGCDDCQVVCPWNKFAKSPEHTDFDPRHGLDQAALLDLWAWTEQDFDERTLGSAIRRIGWGRWRRNLAVALGNMTTATAAERRAAIHALQTARTDADSLVAEHIDWALRRLQSERSSAEANDVTLESRRLR